MNFYVYEHWRPDKNECFYVGKGHGRRARRFTSHKFNRHYSSVVAKLKRLGMRVEIRIVADGLSEVDAFAMEKARIAFWRENGGRLTNLTDGGEGKAGFTFKHRPEVREMLIRVLREANLGRPLSPEHRAKLSVAMTNRKMTAEHCAKIGLSRRGKKHTAESRAKISVARMGKKYGPLSAEHRANISAGNTGKVRGPLSDAHRAKLSAFFKGRARTPETRAKIGATLKGRYRAPASAETRAKMSASHKRRHSTEHSAHQ